MNNKKFGTFLIERGIVSEKDMIEALREQRNRTEYLEKIAVDEGMLSAQQIMQIMDAQAETGDFFCRIAREKKLLSEADIERLLGLQQQTRLRIGELLIELDLIDKKKCNVQLAEYLKSSE